VDNSELAGRIAAIRQAGDGAALLGMANLIERAVVEWATDVTPWVQVGLIAPDQADDLRTYPELMAHFVAEMKQLAVKLKAEARADN
jgi:hypothetical protein